MGSIDSKLECTCLDKNLNNKKHADGRNWWSRGSVPNQDSLGSVFSDSKYPLYNSALEQDAETVPVLG